MKTLPERYFNFTRNELNGLLVLVMLIVIITCLPAIYGALKPGEGLNAQERQAITRLELAENKVNNVRVERPAAAQKSDRFMFDPNTVSIAEWQRLGLSAKQAKAIINYRNKGGRFFTAQDLQKMYTIKPELYQELLPFVHIAGRDDIKHVKVFNSDKDYKRTIPEVVDINTADTLQLDAVKGIGAAFARRIVNYRNRLGGYYQTAQLMEVYGIDSVKYAAIKSQVKIEAPVRKINLNTATFEELKQHPYLKYKQINAIIRYREQHGNFSDITDLKKIILLDELTINKITPYITF